MKKKLTVDVFADSRCPAWAMYAAVDADGTLCFYGNEPSLASATWEYSNSDNNWCWFGDDYYASDWKNSLIKRPETKEERRKGNNGMTNYDRIKQMSRDEMVTFLANTENVCDFCADKGKACGLCYDGVGRWLDSPVKSDERYPDWAMPDNWVYNKELKKYVQIGSMTESGVSLMNGAYGAVSKETFLQDYVEATYRPYNHDELMNLVGEKLDLPDAICLVTAANKERDFICVDNMHYNANELLESKYTYKGNKCGVLVHKDGDEWVD